MRTAQPGMRCPRRPSAGPPTPSRAICIGPVLEECRFVWPKFLLVGCSRSPVFGSSRSSSCGGSNS
eukprot:8690530-Lingulodinium_polyedra.AAC.1